MNLAIHLFALLAFTVLSVLYLKSRRETRLLRAYLVGALRKQVSIDWPSRFLRTFAKALGVPFSGFAGKGEKPSRLKKYVLFDTLLLYGINGIKYEEVLEKKVRVIFYVNKSVPNEDVLKRELSDALQVDAQVVFAEDKGEL